MKISNVKIYRALTLTLTKDLSDFKDISKIENINENTDTFLISLKTLSKCFSG